MSILDLNFVNNSSIDEIKNELIKVDSFEEIIENYFKKEKEIFFVSPETISFTKQKNRNISYILDLQTSFSSVKFIVLCYIFSFEKKQQFKHLLIKIDKYNQRVLDMKIVGEHCYEFFACYNTAFTLEFNSQHALFSKEYIEQVKNMGIENKNMTDKLVNFLICYNNLAYFINKNKVKKKADISSRILYLMANDKSISDVFEKEDREFEDNKAPYLCYLEYISYNFNLMLNEIILNSAEYFMNSENYKSIRNDVNTDYNIKLIASIYEVLVERKKIIYTNHWLNNIAFEGFCTNMNLKNDEQNLYIYKIMSNANNFTNFLSELKNKEYNVVFYKFKDKKYITNSDFFNEYMLNFRISSEHDIEMHKTREMLKPLRKRQREDYILLKKNEAQEADFCICTIDPNNIIGITNENVCEVYKNSDSEQYIVFYIKFFFYLNKINSNSKFINSFLKENKII